MSDKEEIDKLVVELSKKGIHIALDNEAVEESLQQMTLQEVKSLIVEEVMNANISNWLDYLQPRTNPYGWDRRICS